MKFEIGKKYPTRGGGRAKLLGEIDHPRYPLVWAVKSDVGYEGVEQTTRDGRINMESLHSNDIISDEPIREKVEVKLVKRFVPVTHTGALGGQYETPAAALLDIKSLGEYVGIYELDETILVTPK
jgi:hypothetical protein